MSEIDTIPIGSRFSSLIILRPTLKTNNRREVVGYSVCRCDCGSISEINNKRILTGRQKSCGCLGRRHERSPYAETYGTWASMIQRCTNSNNISYRNYGARGISVCKSWLDFFQFLKDMGIRPTGGTIERIDNEKGYCKENCCWSTKKQQARNRRCNIRFNLNGLDRPLCEICEILGLHYSTVRSRILRGWTYERSIGHPIKNRTR